MTLLTLAVTAERLSKTGERMAGFTGAIALAGGVWILWQAGF